MKSIPICGNLAPLQLPVAVMQLPCPVQLDGRFYFTPPQPTSGCEACFRLRRLTASKLQHAASCRTAPQFRSCNRTTPTLRSLRFCHVSAQLPVSPFTPAPRSPPAHPLRHRCSAAPRFMPLPASPPPPPFTPSGGRVTWRSLTRVASLRRAPPHVMRQLASAAVFAVAVAAEFPGRKRDETASSTCAARRYPPSFAASWSSSSALSQTWSAASCAVVTSLPLPFPLRRIAHPPVHSVVNAHLSPQTVALCGPD